MCLHIGICIYFIFVYLFAHTLLSFPSAIVAWMCHVYIYIYTYATTRDALSNVLFISAEQRPRVILRTSLGWTRAVSTHICICIYNAIAKHPPSRCCITYIPTLQNQQKKKRKKKNLLLIIYENFQKH